MPDRDPKVRKRIYQAQLGAYVLIVIIGVLSFWKIDAVIGDIQDQKTCLQNNFAKLSVALDARSKITDVNISENKKLWGVYAEAAGAIKDPKNPVLSKAEQQRLNVEFVHRLRTYQAVTSNLKEQLKEHPVPPYPPGTCGG